MHKLAARSWVRFLQEAENENLEQNVLETAKPTFGLENLQNFQSEAENKKNGVKTHSRI